MWQSNIGSFIRNKTKDSDRKTLIKFKSFKLFDNSTYGTS